MKHILMAGLAVMASLLVACSSTPYVETDYQAGYDFAQLKTYQVAETRQDAKENLLISPFTLSHIHSILDSELSKRYQAVVPDNKPDFIVNYHVVVEEKIDPRSYNELYGWYGRGYYYPYPRPLFYGVNSGVRVYEQGSLIVDIIDGKTDKPLWRGISQKRLSRGLSPQKQREVLSGAVVEVMSQFPPVK